ncbi:MAG: N-formylglutamate amidohydrolase [bacterium]|nr:N-formylglutamate amidohydrolase [bacterium]
MSKVILLSCEHAVNTVPEPYQYLFGDFSNLLESHRGIDFGALTIAEHLQEQLSCTLIQAHATRLLIDCNRSINHRSCFSEVTSHLDQLTKQHIIDVYYTPYRQQIINLISNYVKQGVQVIHLSIHSFTPVMDGTIRNADIAFLYDPKRQEEQFLAKRWNIELKKINPAYRIRMNYPYQGISDGLTTALRKQFAPHQYLGVEIESNQALTQNVHQLTTLKIILAESLLKAKLDILRLN